MIRITDSISIDESELSESFIRASGPGGQNVNKVSSAVQLRFDARHSFSLPNDVAVRLMRLAGKRLTKDGVIVIVAQQHRTQERNREDARNRLFEMIRQAAVRPTPRRPRKCRSPSAAKGWRPKSIARPSKAYGAPSRVGTSSRDSGGSSGCNLAAFAPSR